MVYQKAKLFLLNFYYDFLIKIVKRENFLLAFIDTDSFYIGIPAADLNSVALTMKKAERRNFFEIRDKFLIPEACSECRDEYINTMVTGDASWVPRACCLKFQRWKMREPGLFKTEFRGTGVISLSPKSYFCKGDDSSKIAAKGVTQKKKLTWDTFEKTLTEETQFEVENKSFKYYNNEQRSYSQKKIGLTPIYGKTNRARRWHLNNVSIALMESTTLRSLERKIA